MGELRLYAISIDRARDMVGAAPQEAERLRAVATESFRVAAPAPARGLLGRSSVDDAPPSAACGLPPPT